MYEYDIVYSRLLKNIELGFKSKFYVVAISNTVRCYQFGPTVCFFKELLRPLNPTTLNFDLNKANFLLAALLLSFADFSFEPPANVFDDFEGPTFLDLLVPTGDDFVVRVVCVFLDNTEVAVLVLFPTVEDFDDTKPIFFGSATLLTFAFFLLTLVIFVFLALLIT